MPRDELPLARRSVVHYVGEGVGRLLLQIADVTFHLALGLVEPAFLPQPLIVGQIAGGFFESAALMTAPFTLHVERFASSR